MPRKRRRRRAKPGTLEQLTAVLWRTVLEIEALLNEDECPPDRVLRSAHALAQLAGAYRAVIETADFEARLSALEHSMERNGHVP
jgi:hypothetical protein